MAFRPTRTGKRMHRSLAARTFFLKSSSIRRFLLLFMPSTATCRATWQPLQPDDPLGSDRHGRQQDEDYRPTMAAAISACNSRLAESRWTGSDNSGCCGVRVVVY